MVAVVVAAAAAVVVVVAAAAAEVAAADLYEYVIVVTRAQCYKTFLSVNYVFRRKLVFVIGRLFKSSITNTLA